MEVQMQKNTCSFCGTQHSVNWVQGVLDPDTMKWGELKICTACFQDKEIEKLAENLMFNVSSLNWKVYNNNATEQDKDKLRILLKKYKYNYSNKKFNLEIKKECERGLKGASKRNTGKKKISLFI